MRIIAGELRGRRLNAPPGQAVRPTSDSLRETLFNILGNIVEGAVVLDAFAGTGALGLEALSRGAARAIFVESDRRVLPVLRANIERCGVAARARVIGRDFLQASASIEECGLVLLDPPYDVKDLEAIVIAAAGRLARGGCLVLEHRRRRTSPESAAAAIRTRVVAAGDSALSFYQ